MLIRTIKKVQSDNQIKCKASLYQEVIHQGYKMIMKPSAQGPQGHKSNVSFYCDLLLFELKIKEKS